MEAVAERQAHSDDPVAVDRTPSHCHRWRTASERAHLLSQRLISLRLRGALVADLLSLHTDIRGKRILDIGSGEGGTSIVLARRHAHVVAVDNKPKRTRQLRELLGGELQRLNLQPIVMDAETIGLCDHTFDIVILQDVLEHTVDRENVLEETVRVLKPGGLLYLSTPNRFSVLNCFSDPHWGLPLVSILSRRCVTLMITEIYGLESWRSDFAELLSLFQLKKLLRRCGLTVRFANKEVAEHLLETPNAVVWSRLHLGFIRLIQKMKLQWLIRKVVNDGFGFFNHFVNPTWYMICQRTQRD